MKISLTEKFLWDVYKVLYKTNSILDFVLKSPTMRNYLPGPKDPLVEKYKKEMGSKEFSKLIYHLKRKGYVKSKNLQGNQAILLTKKGISKTLKAYLKFDKMVKRADGKWIMIIFDIPQNYWKSRNLLKSVLINLGYKKFQQSVWITPYDVYEKTEKLLNYYSLDKYVRIFLIEEL